MTTTIPPEDMTPAQRREVERLTGKPRGYLDRFLPTGHPDRIADKPEKR